jgi:hypothetical protein
MSAGGDPSHNFAALVLDTDLVSPRALYVGGTGNVSIRNPAGQDIVLNGVQGGSILPVRAVRVNTAGTTASGIVVLY